MYAPMVNAGVTEGPVMTGGVVMAGGPMPTGTYQYMTYTGQVCVHPLNTILYSISQH